MQDLHAAVEAAEEAAEAAEAVAEAAEQRAPTGQALDAEASVASRPEATMGDEGEKLWGL